jgi:hypothetical protein
MKPGTGMGSGMGMGMGSGMGMGKGMGTGTGTGMGPPPPPGGGVSVLAGNMPASPGGAAGSSGAHGGTSPSGATDPETVMAESVDAPPPGGADGVIRAIAEHAAGVHRSETFGPVRDHYAAAAEAAIHRDEIPLTRRDFIQRYFEALRTREDP